MQRFKHKMKKRRWWTARKRALARDHWSCRKCGKIGGRLEVHHIRPVHRCSEAECYDLDNLLTLCRRCHRLETLREFGRILTLQAEQEIKAWKKVQKKIASR